MQRASGPRQEALEHSSSEEQSHELTGIDMGPTDSLNRLVDKLLLYAHRRLLFDELRNYIKAEHPRQYQRFEAELRGQAEQG